MFVLDLLIGFLKKNITDKSIVFYVGRFIKQVYKLNDCWTLKYVNKPGYTYCDKTYECYSIG